MGRLLRGFLAVTAAPPGGEAASDSLCCDAASLDHAEPIWNQNQQPCVLLSGNTLMRPVYRLLCAPGPLKARSDCF
ncbi:MAG: hypothetical protein EB015_09060 [Methylocystaceae bacterium]|nr:hypothetical protein [Methylocystaceae bacterium]